MKLNKQLLWVALVCLGLWTLIVYAIAENLR